MGTHLFKVLNEFLKLSELNCIISILLYFSKSIFLKLEEE